MNDLARILFNKWKASLTQKDRKELKTFNSKENFEELFFELKKHNIDFDVASNMVDEAAAAHMPNYFTFENVFKKMKAQYPGMSRNEFMNNWKNEFTERANAALFEIYDISEDEDDEDNHYKQHGKISSAEYSKQRKYADSFPEVTKEEIEELEDKRKSALETDFDF